VERHRIITSRPLDVYKILSQFEKREREVEGGRNKANVVPQYFLGVVQPQMLWQSRPTDFKPDDVFDHTRLFKLANIVKLNPKSEAKFGTDSRLTLKGIFGVDKVKLRDQVNGWKEFYHVQVSYIRKFDEDDNLSKLCFKNIKEI
jgi:hypothetical protein